MPENRLGARVKELRGDRTQAEIGKAIGLSRARVGQIESGRVPWPDVDILNGLARALDVPVTDLMRSAGAEVPQDPTEGLAWVISQLDDESAETLTEIAHGLLRAQLRRRGRAG